MYGFTLFQYSDLGSGCAYLIFRGITLKKIIFSLFLIICIICQTFIFGYANSTDNIINTEITDTGYDIYASSASSGYGYQYGPSIIVNDDGSMDVWFASQGNSASQIMDYISYIHSDDGVNWTDRKIVLEPTPLSKDFRSCCDPGVIYFGGYYYIGYTSTLDKGGYSNSVFVARSINPDGPYEKWNGEGWGGDPEPLIYFDGNGDQWGIGEPSFVELDGLLYVYYSLKTELGFSTMVALCDADNENWPLTLSESEVALSLNLSDGYSALDVKFDEQSRSFIAMNIYGSFTDHSEMRVYQSFDGIIFSQVDTMYTNFTSYANNNGLSGSKNGHIVSGNPTFIAYAYGTGWGSWSTRIAPYKICYSDKIDNSDTIENLLSFEKVKWSENYYMGITTYPHYYIVNANSEPFYVNVYKYDQNMYRTSVSDNVIFSDYNEDIVYFSDLQCIPVGIGQTTVKATWNGMSCVFKIIIRPDGYSCSASEVYSFTPESYVINVPLSGSYTKQIKGIATTYAGLMGEAFNDVLSKAVFKSGNYTVTYNNFDSQIVNVDGNGNILPIKEGSTTVTAKINGKLFFTIVVNVFDDSVCNNAVNLTPMISSIGDSVTFSALSGVKDIYISQCGSDSLVNIVNSQIAHINSTRFTSNSEYETSLDTGEYDILIRYNNSDMYYYKLMVE